MSLAQAIIYGTLNDVQSWIAKTPDLNELDEYGYTPLIEAAIVNNTAMAELLLKHGAAVDLADMTGRTALHWASDNQNIELSELLLKHGANPNAYTIASQPLLVQPLLRGQKKLTHLLLDHDASLDFAKDYINTKLLAHRYSLQGVVDIVNHQGAFVEVGYEGFFLEFTLSVIYYSLDRFLHHYHARRWRRWFPVLRELIAVFGHAAELIRYQQYQIDRSQYKKRIDELLLKPLLLLPVAYEGHAVSFVKFGDLWAHCDRGEYGIQHGCVNLFKLTDPSLANENFCYRLLYTKQSKSFIEKGISSALKLDPWLQIPLAPQQTGNCSWANVEASIPVMLFGLLRMHQPDVSLMESMTLSLEIFNDWLTWDQDQALDDCIQSFRYSSLPRQVSKAALLGAILLQQCHYTNLRDVKRAQKILSILTLPSFKYVLVSYLDAYCQPRITPAGKNLLELLEDCGVDRDKLVD